MWGRSCKSGFLDFFFLNNPIFHQENTVDCKMLKLYLLGFYLHTGNVIYKKSKGRVWIFAVHRPALYSLLGVREPIQTHRSLAMTTLMWIDAWVRLRIFVLLCWDHKHQEHDVSVTSFCVLWWFPAISPWLLTCFLGKWIRQQRCMSVHCGAVAFSRSWSYTYHPVTNELNAMRPNSAH